jgi:hypothetical protein
MAGDELNIMGDGLHILTSLEEENASLQFASAPQAVAGSLFDLSGVFRVEDPLGGTLNGTFGTFTAPFDLSFRAAPAPVTCTGASLIQCSATAPFTFAANVTFTPWRGTPVEQQLIGAGTATGHVYEGQFGEFAGATYVFDTTVTPEPGTLLLVATALFGLVSYAMKCS